MTTERSMLRDGPRRWAVPLALALVASALELGGDAARAALRYERAAVLDGEWWRLVSGNLVHLGPRHLLLNLVGVALVAALGGRALVGVRGPLSACGAMLGVGLGLLAFAPEVGWYVGLSGALHGLLAAWAVEHGADATTRRWGVVVGGALAAKLAWEQLAGPLPFTAAAAGGPVIVVAHLHGAIAGALIAACLAWRDRGGAHPATRV
jgi:rhomboid family GlyGly-CTERM serine protease